MLRQTPFRFVKELVYFEVWEHFKRFGDARGTDSATCRVLCADDVAERLNGRVKMRYLLEQFLVKNTSTGGARGEQQRWWTGDFSRSVNGDRRVVAEMLLEDGWVLVQINNAVSEREWLVTTMTFLRERS
ncbi:hypothetical protein C3747_3g242c [Trypanosoma cruzi]|uniref:Uncharacterized protein n=2 Tax=Trypanosoma cruzi TaxID=5693 RepID=Q4DBV8_TRYCC|nr:hypothetical protein, conserved [Trypanosoma cruzi]EAN90005.1 hypothetical protein, conserved [Trypanosoma cruzi]PWV21128.1 hypothetical protein C3747_3g242c [Trypanosoma cruzi]RNC46909.1 hypothetical protein TcCL_NonESM03297 [Trypanosoma cruzi]|eukprot:XP_811856.1 hypothetical protein [Trypanosoma cruzi strain CL Brener]